MRLDRKLPVNSILKGHINTLRDKIEQDMIISSDAMKT